jgi:hypothetical protein
VTARKKKTTAKKKAAAKAATPQTGPHVQAQVTTTMPLMRKGMDYQVTNLRLINGRWYESGELLDQEQAFKGMNETERKLALESWRRHKIIVDYDPENPAMPIPESKIVSKPITAEERKAMRKADPNIAGRVSPKYGGFERWYVTDNNGTGKRVPDEAYFDGITARVKCQLRCNEINKERGFEPTQAELDAVMMAPGGPGDRDDSPHARVYNASMPS